MLDPVLLPDLERVDPDFGGEFVAGFSDSDATKKVLAFMSSPEFADARVSEGGAISANLKADPNKASSEFLVEAMKLMGK